MIRTLVLVLIILVMLAVTNPAAETHKKAIYGAVSANAAEEGIWKQLAVQVVGDLDLVRFQYHNYLLFSTVTLDGDTVSWGVLSHVHTMQ
jgi:hypothetical protein